MKYKEIYNFFDDPNEVRNISLLQEYEKCKISSFPGLRSKPIDEDSFIYDKIITTVMPDLVKFDWTSFEFTAFFQYTLNDTPCNEHIDLENNVKHGFSGVIYLNPTLPDGNYGTTIGGCYIENEYNKLVFYDANIPHKPTGTFGTNMYDSRMVIAFFINLNSKLELTLV